MYLQNGISIKILREKKFCWYLVDKSMIRSQSISAERVRVSRSASESVPKCHGSGTLLPTVYLRMRTWVAVSRRAGSVTRRRRMTFLVSSLTRPSSGIVNSAVLILLNSSWNVTMWLNFTVQIQKEVGIDSNAGTETRPKQTEYLLFKLPPRMPPGYKCFIHWSAKSKDCKGWVRVLQPVLWFWKRIVNMASVGLEEKKIFSSLKILMLSGWLSFPRKL